LKPNPVSLIFCSKNKNYTTSKYKSIFKKIIKQITLHFSLQSALNEKNKMLKKELLQQQHYRDNLEKNTNEYREYGNHSFQNISELFNLVQQKEIIIENLKFTHKTEMQEMCDRLQQREQTLKKILESKISKIRSD
jgi:hypothetical protein